MDTTSNSYALVIADAIFQRVSAMTFFTNFNRKAGNWRMRIQPQDVPYLGVYFVKETTKPDGDADAGDIRFDHLVTIGFSVIIKNNDATQAEQKLDAAFWTIINGLLRDNTLTNTWKTNLPDNTRIESWPSYNRVHHWGAMGLNNEMPIAELQFEMQATYRSNFAPIITDDLTHIHIETVPLADDGTVPVAAEVQRIISEYDIPIAQRKASTNGKDS